MKVHVTGGTGFLGHSVVPMLVARGHEVSALVRSEHAAERGRALGASPVSGDLDDPLSVEKAFAASGADVLLNLASLGFGHAPAIVAAAEDAGVKRAIFVSTTAVMTTLNARSKAVRLEAERTIRESCLEWTLVRPTMIYGGPGDRNMWRLLRLLRRTPVILLPGGGRRLQQPVHVDDLALAIVNAVERNGSIGRLYDVAGPEPLSLRALVEEAAAALGRRPRLVAVPLRPTIAVVRVYERLARSPRLRAEQIERLAEDKTFNIDDACTELAFTPRSFADGIRAEAALLA